MHELLAVIPARGGSKRVPGKNIRPFLGRPAISYPIAAALGSGLFRHVLVSTDSEDIAAVARECGARAPFRRPAELADDFASTEDVLLHATQWVRETWGPVDAVCCLYPTAVFATPELLRAGLEALRRGATAAFTVAAYESPVLRALTVGQDGWLRMLWPEYEDARTQDLPPVYRDAGQFYWITAEALFRERRLYTRQAAPLPLPEGLVQDIDTEADWALAESKYLLSRRGEGAGA